jgi:hypothetical protein
MDWEVKLNGSVSARPLLPDLVRAWGDPRKMIPVCGVPRRPRRVSPSASLRVYCGISEAATPTIETYPACERSNLIGVSPPG